MSNFWALATCAWRTRPRQVRSDAVGCVRGVLAPSTPTSSTPLSKLDGLSTTRRARSRPAATGQCGTVMERRKAPAQHYLHSASAALFAKKISLSAYAARDTLRRSRAPPSSRREQESHRAVGGFTKVATTPRPPRPWSSQLDYRRARFPRSATKHRRHVCAEDFTINAFAAMQSIPAVYRRVHHRGRHGRNVRARSGRSAKDCSDRRIDGK